MFEEGLYLNLKREKSKLIRPWEYIERYYQKILDAFILSSDSKFPHTYDFKGEKFIK